MARGKNPGINAIDPLTGKPRRGRPPKDAIQRAEIQKKKEALAVSLASCTPRQRRFVEQATGISADDYNDMQSLHNDGGDSSSEDSGKMPDDIVKASGYSKNMTKSQIMGSAKVRSSLVAAMELRGITDDKLAEVIEDGLTAREDHNDPLSKPERGVRHKFLDTVLRVRGDLAAAKEDAPDSWEARISQVFVTQVNNTVTQPSSNADCYDVPPACDESTKRDDGQSL